MIAESRRRRIGLDALYLIGALVLGALSTDAGAATIEGVLVGEAGQPLANVGVSATDPILGALYSANTHSDGTFALVVPPAVYVVSSSPLSPRVPAPLRVDASSGNVTGLVL